MVEVIMKLNLANYLNDNRSSGISKYSMRSINNSLLLIFLFSFLCFPIILSSQPKIPILKQYANDETSTLTGSDLNNLNSALKAFEDSTSNQVVFLMVSSINGYPLESYTYEVAAKNKIGTSKNNNGVLFFVAKDDRKMRIEVGYGLEGALPDALASSILRNEVRPYFLRNHYYSGIVSGLKAIMLATIGEYKNEHKKQNDKEFKFPFGLIVMIIIFIILSTRGGRRGGGGILPWLIIGSMTGGRGGGSWGGGSGFGGGFGGFSGGGGSFGGGGASGSW